MNANDTPSVFPMSGMAHSPCIVSRCGEPSAKELNICGICGEPITLVNGNWIQITEAQADALRAEIVRRWNAASVGIAAQPPECPATRGTGTYDFNVVFLGNMEFECNEKTPPFRSDLPYKSKEAAMWLRDALNERAALLKRVEELEAGFKRAENMQQDFLRTGAEEPKP